MNLDKYIANISITNPQYAFPLSYAVLCLTYNGQCADNSYLQLIASRAQFSGQYGLKYPLGGSAQTPVYYGAYLANVTTDSSGRVQTSKYLRLIYYLIQVRWSAGVHGPTLM
jgi:hypothetical protein